MIVCTCVEKKYAYSYYIIYHTINYATRARSGHYPDTRSTTIVNCRGVTSKTTAGF